MDETYNISDIPLMPGAHVLTYHEALQSLSNQVSDKMFYMSLFLLFYIFMNMYVFKPEARLRSRFESLSPEIQFWIYELTEDIALMAGLFLVAFNVVFRFGVQI